MHRPASCTRPLLAAYDESVAKIGQVRAAQLRYFDGVNRDA
jgi:hypothetical protein